MGHTKASKKTCFTNGTDTEAVGPFNPETVLLNSVSVGLELDKKWWKKCKDHAPKTGDYRSLAHCPEGRPLMVDVKQRPVAA